MVIADGMEMPEELSQWLDRFNRGMAILKKRGFEVTPESTRDGMLKMTASLVTDIPDVELICDDLVSCSESLPESVISKLAVYEKKISESKIDKKEKSGSDIASMVKKDGVPVRIYDPDTHRRLPVLVYYHGGGHMAGSVDIYDPICRKLSLATDHIVVSVEYRLAPEHPYPAGVLDAYCAARGICETLDRLDINYNNRISLAGDSAGGALSATVSHLSQYDKSFNIACQALIYPSLDYTMSFGSMEENARGYFLEKDKIRWYFERYLIREALPEDEEEYMKMVRKASPYFMEISGSMPATLVVTAGLCPLRDEALSYLEKLNKSGIRTAHIHFYNMIHAFINMESLVPEECRTVYRAIGEFLS